MPARSPNSPLSFSQGSNLRFSPFSRASASPAFSLSSQKSAAAVRSSIPAISLFSVSGSKTPPGLVDARPEGLDLLFELS
jgi:hypothetical protein